MIKGLYKRRILHGLSHITPQQFEDTKARPMVNLLTWHFLAKEVGPPPDSHISQATNVSTTFD